jgi:hypothetical protein
MRQDVGVTVSVEQLRSLALTLPETTEQDHFGTPSFRVRGKIFATVPDDDHVRVRVDESEIRATVAEDPVVFHEFYWGQRLACLVVDLADVDPDRLRELLTEAWLGKAPKTLAKAYQASSRRR